jgi:hypothetical protein
MGEPKEGAPGAALVERAVGGVSIRDNVLEIRRGRLLAIGALVLFPACDLARSGEGDGPYEADDAGASVGPTGYGSPSGGRDASPGQSHDADLPDAAPVAPVLIDAASDVGPDASPDPTGLADAATRDGGGTDASNGDGGTGAYDGGTGAYDGGTEASTLPPPIGAWSFDEGLGTQTADLSGNGHPAVFVGGAFWGPGKAGSGLLLDGISGYADVGVPLVNMRKSYSVVVWARLTSTATWATALSEDAVRGSAFGLKLRGDGTNDFDFDVETSDAPNPGFLVAESTTKAQPLVWVHLAGVYDANAKGTLKLYVNGALEATIAAGQTFAAAGGHFVIGRGLYNGTIGSYFTGTLDEVAVYDTALSDAEVKAVFGGQ